MKEGVKEIGAIGVLLALPVLLVGAGLLLFLLLFGFYAYLLPAFFVAMGAQTAWQWWRKRHD